MHSRFLVSLSLTLALPVLACSSTEDDKASTTQDGGNGSGDGSGPDGSNAIDDGPKPPAELLPAATGPCPGFRDGEGCTDDGTSLVCDFTPEGIVTRPVRIFLGPRAWEVDSPVVVFWHGLGLDASSTSKAAVGLAPCASGGQPGEGDGSVSLMI